jgi:arginine transport system substrate-binding protein
MRFKTLLIVLCLLFPILSNATLNIGTLIFKPPYVVSPGNGFDIDLVHVICKKINEECNIIPMGMDALYDKLNEGKIDFAVGGIPISYTLKIKFIFSLPYMLSKGQFLILRNSPINSVKELQGTTVGVLNNKLNGGVFYEFLQKNFQNIFQIQLYNDVEDVLSDLNDKKIAAAFLDRSSVNYWIQEGGGQFRPLGEIHTIGDGIAIVSLPKNKNLIEQINPILQSMEKDGSYSNLYTTYFANE